MKNPTTILDIGSSKVVCLIGARSTQGGLELYGSANIEHGGLRKQDFFDLERLRESIEQSIQKAEEEARRSVRKVFVGVPATLLDSSCSRVKLNYPDLHKFDEKDIDQVIESAVAMQKQPEERNLIDSYVERFELDGVVYKTEPYGTMAKQVLAVVVNTYIKKDFVSFVSEILADMNIVLEGFVDSTYVEAQLLMPKEAETEDLLLMDIGYYQTSIIFLRNMAPIYRRSLEIGGYQIASDISYVLEIAPPAAEEIKRRHVFGLDYMGQSDSYQMIDGSHQDCDYETIQNIIEARTREIADLLADEIEQAPVTINKKTPFFVTGGGVAMMRGGNEFLQGGLPIPIKKPSPVLPKLNSPNYYSAYGVLAYGIEHDHEKRSANVFSSFWHAIIDFFTK